MLSAAQSEGLRYTSNGSLVIERVLTQHSGRYSCLAHNDFTSALASFQITAGGLWTLHCFLLLVNVCLYVNCHSIVSVTTHFKLREWLETEAGRSIFALFLQISLTTLLIGASDEIRWKSRTKMQDTVASCSGDRHCTERRRRIYSPKLHTKFPIKNHVMDGYQKGHIWPSRLAALKNR